MDLEKNKQRIEILAAEIEELKNSGGGGGDLSDYLTKSEASSTYETQSAATASLALKADKATTYTKTEVDEAIAAAGGGDVIVSGDNVKTKNAWADAIGILIGNSAGSGYKNYQIAIGTRASARNPTMANWPIAIGYQAKASGSGIVIGSNSNDNGPNINLYDSIILGWRSTADSNNNLILGHDLTAAADGQILLGRFNKTSNDRNYFAVGNGYSSARSNLFSFSNNLFYCGNDTTGYDLRYFAPADETLTDGGTISATALANANKHVPLSFNAHMCYYSYEDTNNVYYVSTRLNGASLHTNVVAINKTTGVATFNEFDQS